MLKNLFLWLIIAIVLVSVFSNFGPRRLSTEKIPYSQFLTEVNKGSVASVVIEEDRFIKGTTKNNHHFVTFMPTKDDALLGELLKNKVVVFGEEKPQESLLFHIFINWFPMLLLIGIWVFFTRQNLPDHKPFKATRYAFNRLNCLNLKPYRSKNFT